MIKYIYIYIYIYIRSGAIPIKPRVPQSTAESPHEQTFSPYPCVFPVCFYGRSYQYLTLNSTLSGQHFAACKSNNRPTPKTTQMLVAWQTCRLVAGSVDLKAAHPHASLRFPNRIPPPPPPPPLFFSNISLWCL